MTLQYKNKKNLYKIVFIVVLLGFIISLVGCNWLAFGLLNVFDPQAQIRVDFNPKDAGDPIEGCFNLSAYSINEVEFFITGFSYDYHGDDYNSGEIDIPELSRDINVSFYVKPSSTPGTPGDETIIENIPLYVKEAADYVTLNPFITEVNCDIDLIGVDGAGHNQTIPIVSSLPVLEPGVDVTPPVVVINVTPDTTGDAPFTVIFDASGSTDDRGIESYSWDFGDGTSGTEIMETHTYSSCGTYIVKLTVTDFWGNEGYATITITVGESGGPIAVISTTPSPPTGTAPLTVVFNASGSTIGEDCEFECGCAIESYSWDFGDGNTGIGVNTTHTYMNPGTYMATLTITDSAGRKGYANVEVSVEAFGGPIAKINAIPESGPAPLTVNFDAYGSTAQGGIVSYDWDFDDGSIGSGITTSHTYTKNGTYIVILTVTDAAGNIGYESKEITVELAGVVNAVIKVTPESASGTYPFTVGLDASESTTSVSGATIVKYTWNYDYGTPLEETLTIPVTTHTYDKEGTYLVQLTVEDSEGNLGYDFVSIIVTEP